MATKNPPPSPLRLPADIKKQLQEQEPLIEDQRKALAVLKGLGMDTKSIEEKLEWADQARKTLLSEFGK